jgi:hypothetical protein
MNGDPITAGLNLGSKLTDFVARFIPDKTQKEKDDFTLAMQELVSETTLAAAQIAVDEAEAKSPDRINHWRGGLGWSCVGAISWHYIGRPICLFALPFIVTKMPVLPDLSDTALNTLMDLVLIMIGSHAVPHVKSMVTAFAKQKAPDDKSGAP